MQGTMSGARRRGRPRTAWIDNIKTWTGLSVEEAIRMTEDSDKWRKYVHGVAIPRIENGSGTEQNMVTVPKNHLCSRWGLCETPLTNFFLVFCVGPAMSPGG